MPTLQDLISRVRLRIKEKDIQYFKNTDIIDLANGQYEFFYQYLQSYDCLFVVNFQKETLSSSNLDITLSDFNGCIAPLVRISLAELIPKYDPLSGIFSWQETATGIKFYNANDYYGSDVSIGYWSKIPSITSDAALTSDIPWPEWFSALYRAVIVEAQEIREHDNSRMAIFAEAAFTNITAKIIQNHGTVNYNMRYNLGV